MGSPSVLEPGCHLTQRIATVITAGHARESPTGSGFQVAGLLVALARGAAVLITDALPSDAIAVRPPCS